jgi:multimeric flavodoxin WrbA
MKITILNGDMSPGESTFSAYIEMLTEKLKENHEVDLYPLHKMDLHYCQGCWNCWWKTPGRCAIHDDAEKILTSVINSDFLIFASPLMAGFTSSALKKITDRFVGLVHPYVILKDGECHHRKRYENYPDFGLILEREADTDEEDVDIIKNIYDRLSKNFHNNNRYIKFTDTHNMEEIIDATCYN